MNAYSTLRVVRALFRLAAILAAGLLAAGLATVPASAAQAAAGTRTAPASATATPTVGTHAATLAMLQARARMAARSGGGNRPGAVFGTVTGPDGRPLTGACVTAFGSGRSLTVEAGADGRFVLSGLRPGRYVLEYRDCAAPTKYLARWSGGVSWRSAATHLAIGSGQVRHVSAMMLRPARPDALLQSRASWQTMVARAAGRGLSATAAAGTGRISGVVTGGGRKLRGVCIVAFPVDSGEGYGATTAKNGTYTIRHMTPGRYDVIFASLLCESSTNWLQQEYPDENSLFASGRAVTVSAGKTTTGIDGHLRLGGEISGTVTSSSGRKLGGMCISADGRIKRGEVLLGVDTGRQGGYVLHALFPGRYAVSSTNGCNSNANYAPAGHKAIKIGYGQVRSGLNIVMPAGAEVTGKVTAGTSTGQPLGGMCVSASNASGSVTGFAATTSAGTYKVTGLTTGRYQLQFEPGCDSDANYVPAYATVHLTEGKVRTGVNAALQVGGVISGTVTNTGGKPVANLCIELSGTSQGSSQSSSTGATAADGTYQITELAAGSYEVGFLGGCGNKGSYAPNFYDNQTDPDFATPIVLPAAGTQTANAVLQPGATISGKVTGASGAKLASVCVAAAPENLAEFGAFSDISFTGQGGNYSIPDLEPGQYLVDFGCGQSNYGGQWFAGAPDAGDAEFVSASAGATTGVNAVLKPGGSISGVVTGTGGSALGGICVDAISTADKTGFAADFSEPVFTAASSGGRYTISGLAAGRYHVTFQPCGSNARYAQQWYRSRASEARATAVSVTAGATTSGIDAKLAVGGTISGRVVTSAGAPLRNVCVDAFNLKTGDFGAATTSKTGSYTISGLNSATYTVEFVPCNPAVNRVSVLSSAKVTAPEATRRVNATLAPGGSLSGTLTATPSGAGVQDGCVEAISSNPANPGGGVFTGQGGRYSITGLAAGTYQVFFNDPECPIDPSGFAPQWYDNQPVQASANPVTVSVGTTTPSIDAALEPDGEITGTVSGPSGAAPSGVCVTAVPTAGYARTDGVLPVVAVTRAGSYVLADLLPGRYKVKFSSGCGATGYATQWWQAAKSESAATSVSVSADQDVSGVSAALTG